MYLHPCTYIVIEAKTPGEVHVYIYFKFDTYLRSYIKWDENDDDEDATQVTQT